MKKKRAKSHHTKPWTLTLNGESQKLCCCSCFLEKCFLDWPNIHPSIQLLSVLMMHSGLCGVTGFTRPRAHNARTHANHNMQCHIRTIVQSPKFSPHSTNNNNKNLPCCIICFFCDYQQVMFCQSCVNVFGRALLYCDKKYNIEDERMMMYLWILLLWPKHLLQLLPSHNFDDYVGIRTLNTQKYII